MEDKITFIHTFSLVFILMKSFDQLNSCALTFKLLRISVNPFGKSDLYLFSSCTSQQICDGGIFSTAKVLSQSTVHMKKGRGLWKRNFLCNKCLLIKQIWYMPTPGSQSLNSGRDQWHDPLWRRKPQKNEKNKTREPKLRNLENQTVNIYRGAGSSVLLPRSSLPSQSSSISRGQRDGMAGYYRYSNTFHGISILFVTEVLAKNLGNFFHFYWHNSIPWLHENDNL